MRSLLNNISRELRDYIMETGLILVSRLYDCSSAEQGYKEQAQGAQEWNVEEHIFHPGTWELNSLL